MTPTEKIVSELCNNTFLSFWSFPNPIGKKGKELCDLLVVCDPYIIIFSVKDISVNESGDTNLDIKRWLKRAIDSSVNQIYGAERIINLKNEIQLKNKTEKVLLPDKTRRKIYRVAVAFGRGDKFPLKYGELGKGFVHVFDERSIHIVLRELDTITDFTDFLKAKEDFTRSNVWAMSSSGEDMLALYFKFGFSYPDKTFIFVMDDLWEGYCKSQEYIEEKKENEPSYMWDGIIETMYNSYQDDSILYSDSREEIELAVRQMNKENRFGRRQLSKCFQEVIGQDDGKETPISRIVKADIPNSPVYVFLARPFEHRKSRLKELQIRCLIGKQMHKDSACIIGIATEKYKKNKGFSLDICYFYLPEWNDELENRVNHAKNDLELFTNFKEIRITPDGNKHYS